jgi:hypothetical protein
VSEHDLEQGAGEIFRPFAPGSKPLKRRESTSDCMVISLGAQIGSAAETKSQREERQDYEPNRPKQFEN